MYASAFVLGFHGCDESVGEKILAGKEQLETSVNEYDWFGEGIYLWENSPRRALDLADFVHANPKFFRTKITKPFVLGDGGKWGQTLWCVVTDNYDYIVIQFLVPSG